MAYRFSISYTSVGQLKFNDLFSAIAIITQIFKFVKCTKLGRSKCHCYGRTSRFSKTTPLKLDTSNILLLKFLWFYFVTISSLLLLKFSWFYFVTISSLTEISIFKNTDNLNYND